MTDFPWLLNERTRRSIKVWYSLYFCVRGNGELTVRLRLYCSKVGRRYAMRYSTIMLRCVLCRLHCLIRYGSWSRKRRVLLLSNWGLRRKRISPKGIGMLHPVIVIRTRHGRVERTCGTLSTHSTLQSSSPWNIVSYMEGPLSKYLTVSTARIW